MIKGVGKRIVLLNNTESEIFEQAIFILRNDDKQNREDLVKECERIMNSYISGKNRKIKPNGWKIAFYFLLVAFVLFSIITVLTFII